MHGKAKLNPLDRKGQLGGRMTINRPKGKREWEVK